jgi:CzcA family heavy metal efflux pump
MILSLGGIFAIFQLPISLYPNIDFPRIVMLADNGEEPADRMMIEVTRPLEEAARAIPGVTRVRSATSRGSSEIDINFKWGTDIIQALQLLQGKVSSIRNELPSTASIDIERMNAAVFPIEGFSLTSDSLNEVQLRDLAYYVIRPVLVRIDGVSEVKIVGGKIAEFLVDVDPQRLQSYGLSVNDVAQAVERTNFVSSTGLVQRNYQIYLSLVNGLYESLDDIKNTVISLHAGVPIKITDVANVEPSEKIEYIRVTADGKQAVLVNILRQPDGNTVAIGKRVTEALQQLSSAIPPSVKVKYFYDQGDFISSSIGSARDSIGVGILLAIVILFVFLRSFRISAVAIITVPAVFATTLFILYSMGCSLNIMTLGGIAAAVGLVIDDTVVFIENIFRQLRTEQGNIRTAVSSSMKELLPAIIGSSLSTIVVFIPFAFLSGVTGAFFKSLAVTIAVALMVSLIYSLTLVPVLAELFIGKRDTETEIGREERSRHGLSSWYRNMLAFLLKWKNLAPLVVILILASTYFLYRHIGSGFMPDMDEGAFVLDYNSPPGTSLDETNRMLMHVEKIIMSIPEIDSYSRRTGTQLGFFITEPNNGDFLVKLKSHRSRSVFQIMDELREKIEASEPALRIDFGQAMQDLIGDLTNTPAPIEIKIFGPDQNVVEEKAKDVAGLITNVPGIVDVFNGIVISGPSLIVKVDKTMAARAGLTPEDVLAQLQAMIDGTVDTYVLRGEKLIGVRVRFPNEYHSSLEDIENVSLKSPNGFYVLLKNIATVDVEKGQSEIDREDLKLMVPVTARISGRDLGSTVADIKQVLNQKLVFPQGVAYSFGGQYQSQQESFLELLIVLIAASLLVAMVLLLEFESFVVPFAVFSTNITSLFGVFLALFITGIDFNISSFVGMIMMVGIVAENAIFIIHMSKELEKSGKAGYDALVEASVVRARPILMTMLAAVFALAPLALGIGAGAQMQQPLAVAVIGGFSVSTFLLLFLLPMMYAFLRKVNCQEVSDR